MPSNQLELQNGCMISITRGWIIFLPAIAWPAELLRAARQTKRR